MAADFAIEVQRLRNIIVSQAVDLMRKQQRIEARENQLKHDDKAIVNTHDAPSRQKKVRALAPTSLVLICTFGTVNDPVVTADEHVGDNTRHVVTEYSEEEIQSCTRAVIKPQETEVGGRDTRRSSQSRAYQPPFLTVALTLYAWAMDCVGDDYAFAQDRARKYASTEPTDGRARATGSTRSQPARARRVGKRSRVQFSDSEVEPMVDSDLSWDEDI
ncbi:hypothetical protein OBBRIDRAFT_824681 [Obba rivulosa]|uniref:Uncharacterized protein n=1 Tax=Obba rivulosa TaxID=1052685 RepID=A0A8E2B270_9APHY|nr:hypothetical protein OBBRIDRAFT_824681 [Obba rivulosa]